MSDVSDSGSVYSLPTAIKQRSDSLTNLFYMSEDSESLSNLSIASYSLSQHSYENPSCTNLTAHTTTSPVMISSQQQQQYSISNNDGSDKISRKQWNSSYRSLNDEQSSPTNNRKFILNNNNHSHRSGDSTRYYYFYSSNISGNSSTASSQKIFPIKTAETVLNTIGINTSLSNDDLMDKYGLIAHDGNDLDNNDDDHNNQTQDQQHQYDDMQNTCDSSEENELDMITSSTVQMGRGLRKTVLSNVDRLLNSGSKQIKL